MEFQKWPKIPRLNRDMIITEKIDGTNAQIFIVPNEIMESQYVIGPETADYASEYGIHLGDSVMFAGSRKRFLSYEKDNFGFWKWADENKGNLALLGPGRHYGEWWGQGIQRKYGEVRKRFSLFNVSMYRDCRPACCDVVPILYEGPFDTDMVDHVVFMLKEGGSHAVQGFMNPEGVVVFHVAANKTFKVTCHNDETPKALINNNN
jgi:hypothetical protein